jgi:hypothetical protein
MTRFLILLLLLPLAACSKTAGREADHAELLRLHEQARTAHLEKKADLLVSTFSDSFVQINHGVVSRPTHEESRRRMQTYFDRSTFQEWDDTAPPIIRISPDGHMAYVIVQKSVRLTSPDSSGAARAEHSLFAWVEIYEKQAGKWTLMAVASTDRPDTPG